jgi:hypothetical protein
VATRDSESSEETELSGHVSYLVDLEGKKQPVFWKHDYKTIPQVIDQIKTETNLWEMASGGSFNLLQANRA